MHRRRSRSRMLRGIWVQERNLADPADLAAILAATGLSADAILAHAHSPEIAAELAANAEAAQAAGVFCSPTWVVEGVRFFGQDRLDFVAEVLAA